MPLSPADLAQIAALIDSRLNAARIKISNLPAVGAVSRDAVYPLVDSGSTQKQKLSQLLARSLSYVSTGQGLRNTDSDQVEDQTLFAMGGVNDPGDGGFGLWLYDEGSVEADNIGTVIPPDDGNGRFLRQYTGWVDARWFGAKPNDITFDSTEAIQAAIDFASQYGITVYLRAGKYYITDSLVGRKIDGEPNINTFVLQGDGGTYQWNGGGTWLVVKPSESSFPRAMLELNLSRFVRVTGIRFCGLGASDAGSAGVHYANQNEGAMFINCGFQNLEMAVQVGTDGEDTPGNDDFCKYDYCDWLMCKYAFAIYGTEAYHHKVTRSIIHTVDFVAKFFKDAFSTSMNSFALRDSYVGPVADTCFFQQGNSRGLLEVIGNLFEVGVQDDMPILYDQPEGTGATYFGSAVFEHNQVNWSGYGATDRPFVRINGWGNVRLANNKFGVLRAIVYSRCSDSAYKPLVDDNNEWSNRPAFFKDDTRTEPGQVIRFPSSRHDYGMAVTADDAFSISNKGSPQPWGWDFGQFKFGYKSSYDYQQLPKGTWLIGETPGEAGTAAFEIVTQDGNNIFDLDDVTCDTTALSNEIVVNSVAAAKQLFIGMSIIIAGEGATKTIKNIDGVNITLTTVCENTASDAVITGTGYQRWEMFFVEEEPDFDAWVGSIAWNIAATGDGDIIGWKNFDVGNHWRPFGILGQTVMPYQAASTAVSVGDLVTDFNALLTKLRNNVHMLPTP